jgi:hypothetical protein
MRKVSNTFDEQLQDQLAFLGLMTADQRGCLPDWMVVAPPKTGTSWVYANLRQHPEAFAVDLKELKYFSNRYELEDLRNYLAHFRNGVGKVKGEASPSYSLLPSRTIRLIHSLVPNLKLIYLMREPVSRAWSHARHNFREQEATFKGYTGRFDEVPDEKWIECLTDDWNRLSGDYLGQLQRWLAVFPREQVYLGFFEEIVHSPRRFLRDLLEFLEIDPEFSESEQVILERVNIGIPKDIPAKVHQHLAAIHADRTRELVEYLHDEHGMTVPMEWAESLAATGAPDGSLTERLTVGPWDIGDDGLATLLGRDEMLERDFLGYHIVRREASCVAYPASLGQANPQHAAGEWLTAQVAAGNCLVAANPYDLKSLIVRQCLASEAAGSEAARIRHLEQQLSQVETFQSDVQTSFSKIAEQLRNLEQRQSESGHIHADLPAIHAAIAEHATSLTRVEAQFCENLASVWNECGGLSERYHAIELEQRELLIFSRTLQQRYDELAQSRDELIQCRDDLLQSREDMKHRLAHSNGRLQEAEVELVCLRDRVVALENSLVFRTLRRIDGWLASLRLTRPLRPIEERAAASIDVVDRAPNAARNVARPRNGHSNGKVLSQTAVDEKGPF